MSLVASMKHGFTLWLNRSSDVERLFIGSLTGYSIVVWSEIFIRYMIWPKIELRRKQKNSRRKRFHRWIIK